jgi:hypothetical protein
MISSGDWGVNELMKYLVAIKDTLTPLELDRLRKTAAFPAEASQDVPDPGSPSKPRRFTPAELYEPIDTMRELHLPVLDWGTAQKWRSNSEEGRAIGLSF